MKSIHTHLIAWVLLLFSAQANAQENNVIIPTQINQNLLFLENKGQILNAEGISNDKVLYAITSPQFAVFIYNDGLSYQFTQAADKVVNKSKNIPIDLADIVPADEQLVNTHRIEVKFKNANVDALAVPSKQNNYFENFIAPQIAGGFATANSFEQITINNLYTGIDWVIYQQNGKLKYDLIVHPNGNVNDIAMEIIDAENATLLSEQHLQIKTKLGDINDAGLYCYEKETGTVIPANYILSKNTVGFNVESYNKNQTLVIDPELAWSSYYGGDGEDAVNGMAVDGNGDIIITGYTHSDNNMAYLGYVNSYFGGTFDAYVAKLDANGNRIWGTYFGGTKGDFGTEVVTDNHNDIYVTGFTYSTNFETTPGVHQEELGNNYDAFLIKLNSSGGLIWSTLYGGGNYDYARGIALDTACNVYISGSTSSSLSIALDGWQNTKGGANDEFLAKFTNEGILIWATYMGGELDDYSRAVGVDGENNVYLVGYSESTTGIAYNAFDSIWTGNYDCTLTKYTADGIMLWSTYFGGNGDDNANGIDFDNLNNIYIAVQSSTSTGLCDGGYRNVTGGAVDALLAKFNPYGDRVWSTYYGGVGEDMGKAVCVLDEFVYMSGHTSSPAGIAEYAYQETLGGGRDALIVKFDIQGNFYWGSYAGGTGDEYGRTMCVLTNDAIVVGGKSFSSNFPVSIGAHQTVYGGNPADGFIQRINDCAGALLYFEDADGDLFGDNTSSTLSCSPVAGYVTDNTDCDDSQAAINSSILEICNGFDDNCNGLLDDADPTITGQPTWFVDADFDGYGDTTTLAACNLPVGYVNNNLDCNDANNAINPSAIESCNLIDDDCDFIVDEDVTYITYYADVDLDGYGNALSSISVCTGIIPAGYVINSTDCNDANANKFPGNIEVCNSTDDDCDVLIDEGVVIATATALGPTTFCNGSNVTLQAGAGTGYSFQWKKNGVNISGATAITYVASKTGNYSVLVSVAGGCNATSTSISVTANKKPNPSITALGSLDICLAGSVTLKTASKAGDTYQWFKNGVAIVGATANTYTATTIGTYYVKQTNVSGCFKNSTSVIVTSSCKIGDGNAETLIISPNPATNIVHINIGFVDAYSGNALLLMYNNLGEVVFNAEQLFSNNHIAMQINIPAILPAGMYQIQLIVDGKLYDSKLIINK